MDYLIISFRTILLYCTILLVFRLMGKREIGELSILDLVVFLMIGDIAVIAIEQPETPIMQALLPIFLFVFVQVLFALFSLKSKRFRELIDGHPVIIINKGKVDEQAMRKQRYNFDDLLLQLREKDVRNIADVEFAILEPSGSLSVMQREQKPNGTFTLPLILDGDIQKDHLKKIEKTEFWLRQQLRDKGYSDLKDISFCSFQDDEFYIDRKDES